MCPEKREIYSTCRRRGRGPSPQRRAVQGPGDIPVRPDPDPVAVGGGTTAWAKTGPAAVEKEEEVPRALLLEPTPYKKVRAEGIPQTPLTSS